MLVLLAAFCLPLVTSGRLGEIFSWRWQPFDGKFGILPMCAGSLALSVAALVLAFPLAIGLCALVHVLGRGWPARFWLVLIHFMTGIPTVVYGFVSVFLLVPRMRDWFQAGTGFSLLTAALTMSLLILPTIVLVFQSRLDQLDPMLRLSAEALGFSRIQQMRYVLLPAASRGLAVAAVLGFGRAVGDTLISLMLAGNAAQLPDSPVASIRTLTAQIALVLATDSQSMAYQSVFAAGLLLFGLTAVVNLVLRGAGRRIKEPHRAQDI
ncbi:MAG: ABC transporter permease subunit [Deltaproteobacteria bacterium]|nr:ABC transporter permease subunit [Deltaproteobacteria bacterium]